MEISVRELLKDVFPTNRRKLALGIVDHVKVKHLKESIKELSRTSLFGYFKGKLVLEKTFDIVPEGNII